MTGHTMLIVLGGCSLGVIQLIAGIALGMWIRRSDASAARHSEHHLAQSGLITKRLRELAGEMSSSVGEHRSKLNRASELLTLGQDGEEQSLAELVVDVIGDVVRANHDLQSKLEMAESRLQEQAAEIEAHISRSLTDPLTGLPNRRELNEKLEERMAAWNRRHDVFSLLLLDVDHFKKLNDRHGHLAGDQVLAAIGRALRGAIRREDAVARYGGEEFAVVLPSTPSEQAILVAQKVREAVSRVVVTRNEQQISVTVSVGLATIEPNERVEMLIQRADSALYAAKEAGRNCAFFHNGIDCQLADSLSPEGTQLVGPARLVELINAPDSHKPPADDPQLVPNLEFGTYLPREAISAELAQTCEELRQFVEERGARHETGTTPVQVS
ncbi:MAG TPA: GGDEF domain-containing protein [Lacipirellulaceae bacterium]|nr:GGDEF domain-containing protein [Lacipirellulaceae bacterium]